MKQKFPFRRTFFNRFLVVVLVVHFDVAIFVFCCLNFYSYLWIYVHYAIISLKLEKEGLVLYNGSELFKYSWKLHNSSVVNIDSRILAGSLAMPRLY